MNIAFAIEHFGLEYGGAERYAWGLARWLTTRGNTVDVFTKFYRGRKILRKPLERRYTDDNMTWYMDSIMYIPAISSVREAEYTAPSSILMHSANQPSSGACLKALPFPAFRTIERYEKTRNNSSSTITGTSWQYLSE